MADERKTAVVAVGGNSLITSRDKQSIPDQYEAAVDTVRNVTDMIEDGWNVVLTHGSGPQVGFVLRRSELAIREVVPVPIDYADADIQGALGYMFERALRNEFRRRKLDCQAVALVTMVRVDQDDPAFDNPTKPIGSSVDQRTARRREKDQGWIMRKESDGSYRRVVPSPKPQEIIELDQIRHLIKGGYVVIGCGGGGVPVFVNHRGDYQGMEAVIDKDLASSLLAIGLKADLLLISTSVDKVALNFGEPDEKWLDQVTVKEAEKYLKDGHFGEGDMGPKVQALIDFINATGGKGLITHPNKIPDALDGKTGTHFIKG